MRHLAESDFQMAFTRWIREFGTANGFMNGCAFELKLAHAPDASARAGSLKRSGYLPLRRVEPHQVAALEAVEAPGLGFSHKLTDASVGQKPFDCFFMAGCAAYVVVGVPAGVPTASGRMRTGFEAKASRWEAKASRWEAKASRWEAKASRWEAIFIRIGAWVELLEAKGGRGSVGLDELREIAERVEVM